MLHGFNRLEELIDSYPLQGIKGAMGTQTDLLQLFDGDVEKVHALEQKVAEHLGFKNVLAASARSIPDPLIMRVVSLLYEIISGPQNQALTMRLMAGNEHPPKGQGRTGGSSAMPRK